MGAFNGLTLLEVAAYVLAIYAVSRWARRSTR